MPKSLILKISKYLYFFIQCQMNNKRLLSFLGPINNTGVYQASMAKVWPFNLFLQPANHIAICKYSNLPKYIMPINIKNDKIWETVQKNWKFVASNKIFFLIKKKVWPSLMYTDWWHINDVITYLCCDVSRNDGEKKLFLKYKKLDSFINTKYYFQG